MGEARGERSGGRRPRAPWRGLATVPGAQGAPAELTPEQSERLGRGDERQGVHGPQVEQTHQDDVSPDDVLPLPVRAGSLLAAAVLRAFDPRTDLLLGVAEGDLPPVGGRAWHGWERWAPAAAAAAAAGRSSAGAELSRGGGGSCLLWGGGLCTPVPAFPALLWFLLSSGFQRGLRMQIAASGICCWRITQAAARAKLGCEEEEASVRGGRGRGVGEGLRKGSGREHPEGAEEERPA